MICIRYASPRIFFILSSQNSFGAYFGLRAILNYLQIPNVKILEKLKLKKIKILYDKSYILKI